MIHFHEKTSLSTDVTSIPSSRSGMFLSTITTAIGGCEEGYRNGYRNEALFSNPCDLCSLQDGSFIVAESGNQCIRLVDSSGYVHSLCGISNSEEDFVDGSFQEARFGFLSGMCISSSESVVYVTDTSNNAIRRIDLRRSVVDTLVGSVENDEEDVLQEGSIATARICEPRGIALDNKDNMLYISVKNAILSISIEKKLVRIVAGSIESGHVDDFGKASRFSCPDGLCLVDRALFVADTMNHVIRCINVDDGRVVTVCGNGKPGLRNGDAKESQFKYPQKLSYDPVLKWLFVSELNDCIRIVDLSTSTSFVLAGIGKAGYEDGPYTSARFSFPTGVVWESRNRILFVADSDNHCIRQMSIPAGVRIRNVDDQHSELTWTSSRVDSEFIDFTNTSSMTSKPATREHVDEFSRNPSLETSLSMETLTPRLREGVERLLFVSRRIADDITPFQIRELRTFPHPTHELPTIMSVLSSLLGLQVPGDWQDQRLALFDDTLKDKLNALRVDSLSRSQVGMLRQTSIRLDHFVQDPGNKIPSPISTLIKWIIAFEKAVYYYHERASLRSPMHSASSTDLSQSQGTRRRNSFGARRRSGSLVSNSSSNSSTLTSLPPHEQSEELRESDPRKASLSHGSRYEDAIADPKMLARLEKSTLVSNRGTESSPYSTSGKTVRSREARRGAQKASSSHSIANSYKQDYLHTSSREESSGISREENFLHPSSSMLHKDLSLSRREKVLKQRVLELEQIADTLRFENTELRTENDSLRDRCQGIQVRVNEMEAELQDLVIAISNLLQEQSIIEEEEENIPVLSVNLS